MLGCICFGTCACIWFRCGGVSPMREPDWPGLSCQRSRVSWSRAPCGASWMSAHGFFGFAILLALVPVCWDDSDAGPPLPLDPVFIGPEGTCGAGPMPGPWPWKPCPCMPWPGASMLPPPGAGGRALLLSAPCQPPAPCLGCELRLNAATRPPLPSASTMPPCPTEPTWFMLPGATAMAPWGMDIIIMAWLGPPSCPAPWPWPDCCAAMAATCMLGGMFPRPGCTIMSCMFGGIPCISCMPGCPGPDWLLGSAPAVETTPPRNIIPCMLGWTIT
mmetsp:Transcript_72871/g.235774  ORF Transcript_72871/g.235774 Transcript_72871/m.235774 type:complete len:274 (-) Transcript_72871:367-1188(-)